MKLKIRYGRLAGLIVLGMANAMCAHAAGRFFTQSEMGVAAADPDSFTLQSVEVRRLGEEDIRITTKPSFRSQQFYGGGPSLWEIINIFERVWSIIDQNRPVVHVENPPFAAALPKGIGEWAELSGWSGPKGVKYEIVAKNMYGAKVVDVQYVILRNYSGTYFSKEDSRNIGKYLTSVTAIPTKINIGAKFPGLGYRFTLRAEVPDSSVINMGTREDPIAGMQLNLAWTIETPFKFNRGTDVFDIRGDGYLERIASPWQFLNVPSGQLKSDSVPDFQYRKVSKGRNVSLRKDNKAPAVRIKLPVIGGI